MDHLYFTRVIVESPFAGDVAKNKRYLALCIKDCAVNHSEAAFASHQMYTDSFDDTVPEQRELGMAVGKTWYGVSDKVIVYDDLGISGGMQHGIEYAQFIGLEVIRRQLPADLIEQL